MKIVLLAFCIFPMFSFAQKIEYKDSSGWQINKKIIEKEFHIILNKLRDSLSLNRLEMNRSCGIIAEDQANYLSTDPFLPPDTVSHQRPNLSFNQRIRGFEPNQKILFGENLLPIDMVRAQNHFYLDFVGQKLQEEDIKKERDSLILVGLEEEDATLLWSYRKITHQHLAKKIMIGWMRSPPHYENMINPKWKKYSLRIKKSQGIEGRIYCVLILSN
jgi:uncharacterized protein YkwD